MVNHSCQIFNSSTIKFVFTSKRPWYLNLWKQICEWSGVRFWPPGPVRFSVSSVGQPLFLHQLQEPLFLHQTQEPGKKTFMENIRTVFLFCTGNQFYKTLPEAQRTLEWSCQSNFFRSHYKFLGMWQKSGYFSWLLPLSVGLRLNFITSTEHQQQNLNI